MLTEITLFSLSFTHKNSMRSDDYDVCDDFYQEKFLECITKCESADAVCFSNCNRELVENLEKCPGQIVEAIVGITASQPSCSIYSPSRMPRWMSLSGVHLSE